MTNEAVVPITSTATQWLGHWEETESVIWFDSYILLCLGGIPWQAYFQRVLSSDSPKTAQTLSYVASIGCVAMAVPAALVGAIAASTDWNQTAYGLPDPYSRGEASLILPIVLQYLTPTAVCFIGLGANSAAVMSSSDSSILSASSMFTRNIYRNVFRQNASDNELKWVIRVSIIVIGGMVVLLALTVNSVYGLFYLSGDFVFVILFPQLCAVIYGDPNTYGSLLAYIVGLILRLGGGEPFFNLKPFINYPGGVYFPYKTFSMIVSAITLVVVSKLAKYVFSNKYLDAKWDILECNLAHGGKNFVNKNVYTSGLEDEKSCKSSLHIALDSYTEQTDSKSFDNDAFKEDFSTKL